MVAGPLIGGALLFAGFLVWEARTRNPMLPLALFKRHNFAIGNFETFAMYGGLGVLFFFLVLFLQQVAGYSALEAGASSMPVTLMMFALSIRFGAMADRHGPRFFMGVGPLVTAAGLALFLRLDADVDYLTDLLPALLVFGLGLSMTVAPLTATVLADADESNAGVASGVNNAIARVAGLVAIAGVGAMVAASYGSRLENELGDLANRPEVAAAVEDAKGQPLAASRCRACRRTCRRRSGGGRGGVGGGVPPRHGDRGGAGGAGRHARPGRDPEPAPRRGSRRVPGGQSPAIRAKGRGSRPATRATRPPAGGLSLAPEHHRVGMSSASSPLGVRRTSIAREMPSA